MADPQFGVADYIVLTAIMIVSSLIGKDNLKEQKYFKTFYVANEN